MCPLEASPSFINVHLLQAWAGVQRQIRCHHLCHQGILSLRGRRGVIGEQRFDKVIDEKNGVEGFT